MLSKIMSETGKVFIKRTSAILPIIKIKKIGKVLVCQSQLGTGIGQNKHRKMRHLIS